jgi:hypothetical protein
MIGVSWVSDRSGLRGGSNGSVLEEFGPKVEPAEQLGVERDHHGGGAHEDGADCGGQGDAGEAEDAGGQGYREEVVPGPPDEVLDHLAVRRPGEADDADDRAGVGGSEDDAR